MGGTLIIRPSRENDTLSLFTLNPDDRNELMYFCGGGGSLAGDYKKGAQKRERQRLIPVTVPFSAPDWQYGKHSAVSPSPSSGDKPFPRPASRFFWQQHGTPYCLPG